MPVWDMQLHRVKCAMWKHEQKGGVRYTIAIYRSYKEDGKWKNVHYFDRQDLDDIRGVIDAADEQVMKLEGLVRVEGED